MMAAQPEDAMEATEETEEVACAQCADYYPPRLIFGGLCPACALEAQPPYMQLVEWVDELATDLKGLSEEVRHLGRRVKVLEATMPAQSKMDLRAVEKAL